MAASASLSSKKPAAAQPAPPAWAAVFTMNNIYKKAWKSLKNLDDQVQFIAWQFEKSPTTGKIHIQGYIELKDRKKKASVQKVNQVLRATGVHVEIRMGTQLQAITYCSKDETRATFDDVQAKYPFLVPSDMGPQQTGQPHALAGVQQGKRTDLESMYEMAKSGHGVAAITDKMPGVAIKHFSALQKVVTMMDRRDEQQKPTIVVITGDSGCGKTHLASQMAGPDRFVFSCSANGGTEWWDGYNNELHRTIILDDFERGQIQLSSFLRIMDALDYRCQVKGGSILMKAKMIIITSNARVEDWYPKIENEERKLAIYRRIDALYIMKRGEVFGDVTEEYVGNYDVLTALGKGVEAEKILCMQKVRKSVGPKGHFYYKPALRRAEKWGVILKIKKIFSPHF